MPCDNLEISNADKRRWIIMQELIQDELTEEMIKQEIVVEKSEDEEKIEEIDIRKCKFSTYGGDFIVRQLMDMIAEKEIETPKIQRNYVWTLKIASRFIESILLDLPIPSIFLAKVESGKFIIIDGLQRLTCLYNYIVKGTLNNKVFKLSSSKDIHKEWRGKAFSELKDEDKRKLKNKLLHAIIVEQKEPTNFDGLFLIFERINTGGMQLNQQEIRNSIFQGPMNNLLHELNDYEPWRLMFGQSIPHARMRDIEMILRFLTLNSIESVSSEKDSLKIVSKMNSFMADHRKSNEYELCAYKAIFCDTIDTIRGLFGDDVFRTNLQNLQITQKFYATVFDSIMIATAYAKKKNGSICSSSERVKELFSDDTFRSVCGAHTTDFVAVKTRVEKACEILYGLKYEN